MGGTLVYAERKERNDDGDEKDTDVFADVGNAPGSFDT